MQGDLDATRPSAGDSDTNRNLRADTALGIGGGESEGGASGEVGGDRHGLAGHIAVEKGATVEGQRPQRLAGGGEDAGISHILVEIGGRIMESERK